MLESNPYVSPASEEAVSNAIPDEEHLDVARHLWVNAGWFLFYLAGTMLIGWLEVQMPRGPEDGELRDSVSKAFMLSAFPVAIVANWLALSSARYLRRTLAAIGIAMIAMVAGFIPYIVISLWFFGVIGLDIVR